MCEDTTRRHAKKTPRNIKNCHCRTSFWHVDRHSYVVFGMSTGTGVILACRRAHFGMSTAAVVVFGMSTGTSVILACRRANFGMSTAAVTSFFWHVDGHTSF